MRGISTAVSISPAASTFALSAFAGLLTTSYFIYHSYESTRRRRAAERTKEVARVLNAADARLYLSATELAKGLRDGEYTSYDLVRGYIQHLERINPLLNAVVTTCYQRALETALEADARLEAYRRGEIASVQPFLGVPILSKECYEHPGMQLTSGLLSREGVFGETTCTVLANVEQLGGAIVIATGNVSELCMYMDSTNLVYGRTFNLYDTTRTVGGSSGGTACALSALGAPMAVTSDIGGSIRIPSLYNGVFGHKPSGGTTSNDGTIPEAHGLCKSFAQLGPTSRFASDLMPLLSVMTDSPSPKWTEEVDVSKLRVIDVRRQAKSRSLLGIFAHSRQQVMIEAHDRVVQALRESCGCSVTTMDFPLLDHAFDVWGAAVGKEALESGNPFRKVLANGQGAGTYPWAFYELLKYIFTFGYASNFTLPGVALAALELVNDLDASRTQWMLDQRLVLQRELSEALGDDGVMIFPSLPTTAPEPGVKFLLRATECSATAILNVMELPATAIPLGLSKDDGLPVGVQIVARHGNDHLCIAVANKLAELDVAKWVSPATNYKQL